MIENHIQQELEEKTSTINKKIKEMKTKKYNLVKNAVKEQIEKAINVEELDKVFELMDIALENLTDIDEDMRYCIYEDIGDELIEKHTMKHNKLLYEDIINLIMNMEYYF